MTAETASLVRAIAAPAGVRVLAHPSDPAAVRAALGAAIAAREAVDPEHVALLSTPGGAPRVFVAGRPAAHWAVSFSRTRGCCLGAASEHSVIGVDVEAVDPGFGWAAVAREFFPREVGAWLALSAGEGLRAFFSAWVQLEAALKCRGTGFAGAGRDDSAEIRRAFRCDTLDVGPGHVAALARPLAGRA